jgi:dimethylhistidine N-methyltransferase
VPIWADPNLPELAGALRSDAILAAVRSATAGTSQDESAAAPFRAGRWLFSHSGAIPDWTGLPAALSAAAESGAGPAAAPPLESAALLSLEARSDSALLWAMLASRLRQGEPADTAATALVGEVAAVRPDARINLLLTDGQTIVATRFGDTLWYRNAPGRVLVASEPDEVPDNRAAGPWQEVPENSLLLATRAGTRVLALPPPAGQVSDLTQAARRTTVSPVRRRSDDASASAPASRFTLDQRLPADYLADSLRRDVAAGLSAATKILPPKWFYDARGSDLFEKITRLAEYYPTRVEQRILTRVAPEIAGATAAATVFEPGSGSSRKTRLLLDALTARGTLQCYAPLDVSPSALQQAGAALIRDYPALTVSATVADFEADLTVPHNAPGPRLITFLGSTIGNLDPAERREFYRMLRAGLGPADAFLLGADLVKDRDVLVRAYDDSQGVTAQFNKNVLNVINRELGADFDPDSFAHVALWNEEEERIEMHLRSQYAQTVKVRALDLSVDFTADELMRTEISCKFRRDGLTAELSDCGLEVRRWWTDEAERFALLLAVPSS